MPVKSRLLCPLNDELPAVQYLKVAHQLARKNTCLARKRSSRTSQGTVSDKPLKVGDRVFRKNMSGTRAKTDLRWLPGYRVISFDSDRTAIIEHTQTKTTARVNVRHLRWADPISEIIMNSELDVVPGQSKLYFSAEDVADLDWPAIENDAPLDQELQERIDEVVRDRSTDLTPQPEISNNQRSVSDNHRSSRPRRHPARLNDYLCGFAISQHESKAKTVNCESDNLSAIFSELLHITMSQPTASQSEPMDVDPPADSAITTPRQEEQMDSSH